eukprot:3965713-Karenia_brevis.AAC.1
MVLRSAVLACMPINVLKNKRKATPPVQGRMACMSYDSMNFHALPFVNSSCTRAVRISTFGRS